MIRKLLLIVALAATSLVAAPPAPLPPAGELQFVDHYGTDDTKVVFWWNDGWMPSHWNIQGSANPNPAIESDWCYIQPTFFRYIVGFTNGIFSVAPSKAVVVDMLDSTNNPCIPDFGRIYIPRVWHVRLVPN